jgi:hypothetical protein
MAKEATGVSSRNEDFPCSISRFVKLGRNILIRLPFGWEKSLSGIKSGCPVHQCEVERQGINSRFDLSLRKQDMYSWLNKVAQTIRRVVSSLELALSVTSFCK